MIVEYGSRDGRLEMKMNESTRERYSDFLEWDYCNLVPEDMVLTAKKQINIG